MNKKIIITGASGFVGKALTQSFLETGDTVYAVVRSGESMKELTKFKNLFITEASFEDYDKLEQLIGTAADCFYHLAWQGYDGQAQNAAIQFPNIDFSLKALRSASALEISKFIFTGSSIQYQKKHMPGNSSQHCLSSIYGAAKTGFSVAGRIEAEKLGINFYTTIFSHIFGPYDRAHRSASKIIKQLLIHQPLNLVRADMLYDWTYIDDAVSGLRAVSESSAPYAEYYIGGTPKPFSEIITAARDLLAPDVPLNFGAYPDDSYIDYDRIDLNALKRDTGFSADTPFEKAIAKTAEWLKKETEELE